MHIWRNGCCCWLFSLCWCSHINCYRRYTIPAIASTSRGQANSCFFHQSQCHYYCGYLCCANLSIDTCSSNLWLDPLNSRLLVPIIRFLRRAEGFSLVAFLTGVAPYLYFMGVWLRFKLSGVKESLSLGRIVVAYSAAYPGLSYLWLCALICLFVSLCRYFLVLRKTKERDMHFHFVWLSALLVVLFFSL